MIMKKLLLLLLISESLYSQSNIEIRLVTYAGSPIYTYAGNGYVSTNISDDAGLNAILSAYNVTQYVTNDMHPYEPYWTKTKLILGTYPPQLINDLVAYSSIIASARITNGYEYTDVLNLQLVNLAIGTPVGTSGSIIVTNDTGLNTIFQNFNVFYYAQTYPSSTVNSTLRYYTVVCDCDKNLLNTALLNYTPVIATTEAIIGGGQLLSNNQTDRPKAVVSPNPFSYNFNIQTDQTITNYSIIDIAGKTIINTTSKTELVNQSSQLSAGIYILNLNFDNGQKANYKLVKK
ncbi:MAG: hypothetical protein RL607_1134 [Bacteroidota bacterium]|jgi:hypothetical protein